MKSFLFILFLVSVTFSQSFLNSFTDYNELKSILNEWNVSTESIGKSAQGREILQVKFGDENAPALMIVANIDGDYFISTELALKLIKELKDSKAKLHGISIFIIPMANPDAVMQSFASPQYANPYNSTSSDDDRDMKLNEDPHNDLNKDGYISQMRIKSIHGDFKNDSLINGLLRKINRFQNENGDYLVMPEGFDDDKDKLIDEDGFGGTNINQNFTYNYQFFKKGAGLNQVSEPETKAIADFVFDHPNIYMTIALSHYDNIINPWQVNRESIDELQRPLRSFTKMLKEDADSYKLIAEIFKKTHKDWKPEALNTGDGTFHEWAYFHAGRISLSMNAWNYTQIKLDSTYKKVDKMNKEERLFHMAKRMNLKNAVFDWKAIQHPDFPNQTVEIGGFHQAYLNNAEPSLITESKLSEFVSELTSLYPKIEVVSEQCEKLEAGIYRITVKLKNNGKLPTQSMMGKVSRWMHPLRIEWDLKKENFISGFRKTLTEKAIQGFGDEQEFSWLIKSSETSLKYQIISPVIGKITRTIVLK